MRYPLRLIDHLYYLRLNMDSKEEWYDKIVGVKVVAFGGGAHYIMSPIHINSTQKIDRSSLVEPVQIRTQRYGTLRLKTLSLGDTSYVEKLLRTDPPAREFTVQLVHHQLIEPEFTIELVQDWPDKLLLRVARLWAKNELVLDQNLLEGKISFDTYGSLILLDSWRD